MCSCGHFRVFEIHSARQKRGTGTDTADLIFNYGETIFPHRLHRAWPIRDV
jgi:hypothetical protein